MNQELRRIPIHSVLSRHTLLAGCERELILMTGATSLILIIIAHSLVSAIMGILVWIFCYSILRKMAKFDPVLSKIYMRHIRYKKYYPAHSTPFAPSYKHQR
jgi:type IV secretory pathway TrbD component